MSVHNGFVRNSITYQRYESHGWISHHLTKSSFPRHWEIFPSSPTDFLTNLGLCIHSGQWEGTINLKKNNQWNGWYWTLSVLRKRLFLKPRNENNSNNVILFSATLWIQFQSQVAPVLLFLKRVLSLFGTTETIKCIIFVLGSKLRVHIHKYCILFNL